MKLTDETNENVTRAKRAASGSGKKNKKRKKKKGSGAVLGVVIGLIIALLVVAGGAAFLLYQMGFFETQTDAELLGPTGNTVPVQTEAPKEPEISPAADAVAMGSAVEEEVADAKGSALEEGLEPEEAEEPEETTPEEEIVCEKFTLTGGADVALYARGQTIEPTYVIQPEELRNKIEWESSDETIATVSNIGVISARRGGACTVTGTCGDKSITVRVSCEFTVPSTVLDMNYEDITMNYEGQAIDLKIDYDLTEEQVKNTVWESSDPSVATVDASGHVVAVASGTAIISASIADYTASCIVRCVNVTGNKGVNPDSSEYVINYEDVTLTKKGQYFQLTLKSILGNEVPAFTWKSDDTKIATVDSKGIVTAVANGTAKITASVGGDDFQCIVRVNIS